MNGGERGELAKLGQLGFQVKKLVHKYFTKFLIKLNVTAHTTYHTKRCIPIVNHLNTPFLPLYEDLSNHSTEHSDLCNNLPRAV